MSFRVVQNVSSLNCRATVRIIRVSMVNKIQYELLGTLFGYLNLS